MLSTKERIECYRDGHEAGEDGAKESDNPHPIDPDNNSKYAEWRKGWQNSKPGGVTPNYYSTILMTRD